jgi:hypothetical protein
VQRTNERIESIFCTLLEGRIQNHATTPSRGVRTGLLCLDSGKSTPVWKSKRTDISCALEFTSSTFLDEICVDLSPTTSPILWEVYKDFVFPSDNEGLFLTHTRPSITSLPPRSLTQINRDLVSPIEGPFPTL